ncbi:hypothetical protein JCM19236_5964 [Vibrio sp. JCM 19236]|nr:hypothetical protein JCM19236_5964 [Vibrio sp. JCM 19236]
METLQLANERVWFDKELLNESAELSCEAPFWYVQDKVVGTAKGEEQPGLFNWMDSKVPCVITVAVGYSANW